MVPSHGNVRFLQERSQCAISRFTFGWYSLGVRTQRSVLAARLSFRGMQRPIQVLELIGVADRADRANPALVDVNGEHEAHLTTSTHDQGRLAVHIGYLRTRAWRGASPSCNQKLRDSGAP